MKKSITNESRYQFKRFRRFKGIQNASKWGFVTLITVLVLSLTGCSTSSVADVPNYSKTYNMNQIVTMDPIKLRIDNVSLVTNSTDTQSELQGHVAIGIEVGNTASEDVRFFPDQLQVTTNTGEQLSVDTAVSGDLTDSMNDLLPPKRVLQGYIMFPLKTTNPEDVKEIKLKIVAPQNEKGQPLCEDKELVIPIQQT